MLMDGTIDARIDPVFDGPKKAVVSVALSMDKLVVAIELLLIFDLITLPLLSLVKLSAKMSGLNKPVMITDALLRLSLFLQIVSGAWDTDLSQDLRSHEEHLARSHEKRRLNGGIGIDVINDVSLN